MSATCYANLRGATIIKCKLGRRRHDTSCPVSPARGGPVLLSSQNKFCRDYRCNHSLHVWLSFQRQGRKKKKRKKKAPSLESESISRLQRHSSLEVAGPLRLIAHPEAVPFRVRAEGGWHASMSTLAYTSAFEHSPLMHTDT